jgi:uncharacterized membrane protein YeaQ/YmgE (transglycosylase-associated protein family)
VEENMLSLIWTCIIGLVAGLLAKWIMPGPEPGGIIVTILLGIAGSFVAGWLGHAVGWYGADEGPRFIGSTVGALIILFVYKKFVTPAISKPQ